MTIQRQYSLPNCTLVLEGFGDAAANPADFRPVMSILTNVECRLLGQDALRGGKDFFESLVATVSLYAQEVLSGIRVPTSTEETHSVNLKRLGPDQHQLTFAPAAGEAQVIDLNTVQLFDLVEAIDQFIADTQTLPQWSLGLKPASKHFAPKEPIGQQAMPIAAGLGSLALAAAAFAAIPTPQIKAPQDLTYSPTAQTSSQSTGTTDKLANDKLAASSAAPGSTAKTTAKVSNPIKDPEVLSELGSGLEKQLQANFNPKTPVAEAVSYEVMLGKDGKILGYRPTNDTATTSTNQTPLPDLRYSPVPGSDAQEEAVASFRAEFTPEGRVKVAPWQEQSSSKSADQPILEAPKEDSKPSAAADESAAAPSERSEAEKSEGEAEKSESDTAEPEKQSSRAGTEQGARRRSDLVALQAKLYNRIDQAWTAPSGGVPFEEDLAFSVRVDGDGKIIDYVPYNAGARTYSGDTPLPNLGKVGDSDEPSKGSFERFKVVFTPAGQLQVNPWDGYPEVASAE